MLRPTPGELLEGIRRELTDQVLPEVPPGAATRQLRAALHALARIERSWDLLPACLEADNEDLRATLPLVAELAGRSWAERPGATDAPGVHDPRLKQLMRDNAGLQADLEELQKLVPVASPVLLDLHVRMTARAQQASGLDA